MKAGKPAWRTRRLAVGLPLAAASAVSTAHGGDPAVRFSVNSSLSAESVSRTLINCRLGAAVRQHALDASSRRLVNVNCEPPS